MAGLVAAVAILCAALVGCVEDLPKSEFQFATPEQKAAATATVDADATAEPDTVAGGATDMQNDADDAEPADVVDAAVEIDVPPLADVPDAADVADVTAEVIDAEPDTAPDTGPEAGPDLGPDVDASPTCVAAACNDNNPCTDDGCADGKCANLANAATCTDGNACTVDDTCKDAACLPGSATACDDGNPCTDDSCDKAIGCAATANTKACDDGNACTQVDTCKDKTCIGSKPLDCNDNNPCTADACLPASGCIATANDGAACDDGNPCTQGDACAGKVCAAGGPIACPTGEACVLWKCDPVAGKCKAGYAQAGTPCDDGSACTKADACASGECVGSVVNCDDGNPCTDDACATKGGCQNGANTASCDADGDACTVGDVCKDKVCGKGKVTGCDDGNVCTADSCVAATGKCAFVNKEAAGCDDGNACTVKDLCGAGVCAGEVGVCEDNNPCTDNGCKPASGCVFPANGAPCDDANACTKSDGCKAGGCVGLPVVVTQDCDDGNPCTDGGCDPKSGCAQVANGAGCSDGNPCTEGDVCKASKCQGGVIACGCQQNSDCAAKEDGDLCNGTLKCDTGKLPFQCVVDAATIKVCDASKDGACEKTACVASSGQCVKAAANEGKGCDADGSVCTSGDVCAAGVCKVGGKVDCDDKNPCTDDACDAKAGCTHGNNAAGCDADGDACTVNDGCNSGVCLKGAGKVCDDSKVCTVDACDPKTGACGFASLPLDGTACDADGSLCTVADTCQGGNCKAGAALGCDDGNSCTADSCNKVKGCEHVDNSAGCSDGDACTTQDTCVGGACNAGPIKNCDDGNSCTAPDSCKAGACVPGPQLAIGEWKYGGVGMDALLSAVPLFGGFVAVGETTSLAPGGAWIARIDDSGAVKWQVALGGAGVTSARGVVVTGDGIVVAAKSNPGSFPSSTGQMTISKVDMSGKLVWSKTYNNNYGGWYEQSANCLMQVDDGLVFCGAAQLVGGNANDMVLGKTSSDGELFWLKSYGGAGYEFASACAQIKTGFALVGTKSYNSAAADDLRIVRTEAGGGLVWSQIYGGSGEDAASAVRVLADGLVVVGRTNSKGAGKYDVWLLRTDLEGMLQWEKTFGGTDDDRGFDVQAIAPGFVVAGETSSAASSAPDALLTATDDAGSIIWSKTLGGDLGDRANSVTSLSNGFLLVGFRDSDGISKSTGWLVRTDKWGNSTCATSGPCASKTLADCADPNPCTADLCDAAHNGCYHTNLPDASPCGGTKTCKSGICQ